MEEKKKIYDFTKVMMEVEFDSFEEVDLSKAIGNAIHQNTGDIGLDEVARTIYKEGKAEMTEDQAQEICNILRFGKTTLLVGAKKAAIELLTKGKE